jgi:hypothetical protein
VNFLRLIRTKPGSFVSASSGHEEELFLKDSAGILGSNFPNPDRVGCPDRLTLQRIASRTLALKEISPWLKHLSTCSDCFRDVGQLRRAEQIRRAVTWTLAGAAAAVVVAVLLIARSTGKLGTNHSQEAILDLRNAYVNRGIESGGNQGSGIIPRLSRASRRVSVYLPADRQGAYDLRIIDGSGAVVAAAAGIGKAADSATVLQIKIDLSRATPGSYSLLIKRDTTSTIYRIQIE